MNALQEPTASPVAERRSNLVHSVLGFEMLGILVFTLVLPFSVFAVGDAGDISLAELTGRDAFGILRYVSSFGLLFGVYILALVATKWWKPSPRIVLGFSAAFIAATYFVFPVTAIDSFLYSAQARVLAVYGESPYEVPPNAFPADPYLGYIDFEEKPSAYGPVWIYISAIPALIAGDEPVRAAFGIKAIGALSLFACVALVRAIAERVRPGSGAWAALVLGWNPLAIWSAAGNGHNDIVMMLFVLIGVYLLFVRPVLSPAALVLAAMIKITAIILMPLFMLYLWRRAEHRPALVGGLALASALAVGLTMPLWTGLDTLRGVLLQVQGQSSMSPGAASVLYLQRLGMEAENAWLLARAVFYGAFAGVYGLLVLNLRPAFDSLSRAAFGVIFALLIFGTFWFRFWYLLWLIPVVALLPPKEKWLVAAGLAFSGTALLRYLFTDYTWIWLGFGLPAHVGVVLAVFALPVALWLASVLPAFWKDAAGVLRHLRSLQPGAAAPRPR